MPVNIDDIKKLPNEEKLKVIDQIWEGIEEGREKLPGDRKNQKK